MSDLRKAAEKALTALTAWNSCPINEPGLSACIVGGLQAANELSAALAPAAPQGEASGWKLVPVEPTEAMCEAGRDAQNRACYSVSQPATGTEWAAVYYRAMLAAAPAAPQAQGEQADDHETIMRLGALLDGVARAVRGEPAPGTRWGYADLPERVAAAMAALKGAMEIASAQAQGDYGSTTLIVTTRHPQDYTLRNAVDGTLWSGTPDGWVATPPAPAPQGEPVAYLYQHGETGRTRVVMADAVVDCAARWSLVGPLTLTPPAPAREPLTVDRVCELAERHSLHHFAPRGRESVKDFAWELLGITKGGE